MDQKQQNWRAPNGPKTAKMWLVFLLCQIWNSVLDKLNMMQISSRWKPNYSVNWMRRPLPSWIWAFFLHEVQLSPSQSGADRRNWIIWLVTQWPSCLVCPNKIIETSTVCTLESMKKTMGAFPNLETPPKKKNLGHSQLKIYQIII